jgi:glycosyltransferase involved in cell wall biosynthesis
MLRLLCLVLWGRLFRFEAAYVESSSSSAAPVDVLALLILRLLRRPILIYVRDAYPMFPLEFPARGWSARLLYFGWRLSIGVYKLIATKLLFPTPELAAVFDLPDSEWELLPPGGVTPPDTSRCAHDSGEAIGYVGGISTRYGVQLLPEILDLVEAKRGRQPKCIVVGRRHQWPLVEDRPSIELREAAHGDLELLLSEVGICLIPLAETRYNLMALPIKLFDYMSLGKAIITTRLPNVARLVEEENIGIVCEDNPESLATAIAHLLDHPDMVKQFRRNAREAIRSRHSWRVRAERLLRIMNESGANLTPREHLVGARQ